MSWVDIAVGAGGSATALGILGTLVITQAKHAVKRVVDEVVNNAVKDVADEVTAIRLKLTAETGGNSHGLRQKLNETSEDVAAIMGYLGLPR